MIRAYAVGGRRLHVALWFVLLWLTAETRAELPSPFLQTVFPAGGQVGTAVTVTVKGTALEGLRDVRTTVPHLTAKKLDENRFSLMIPDGIPPGIYDLRVVGTYGLSEPRAFFVSNRVERLEAEPNDTPAAAQEVHLDVAVNGRIEKPGDVDCYRFTARAGQRVVLECWADRIDSQLRAVLEVYDAHGKRLGVSWGYSGIDPMVDFVVPADGTYIVRLFDLTFLGSADHFYRLDIDTKPRVEFALPSVVTRGQTTRIKLFGRNLRPASGGRQPPDRNKAERDKPATRAEGNYGLDCVEVEVTPPPARGTNLVPMRLRSAQLEVDFFAFHYPGGHAPVLVGVTDVPVVAAAADNVAADHAQELPVPCEVSGQLTCGDAKQWYAVQARRGEVLWLEAFGERLGSPVDLDLTVLEPAGPRRLLKLADNWQSLGGYWVPAVHTPSPNGERIGAFRFSTMHLDPSGRWVAPADGRYLILVRSLIGGLSPDPRRVYRLSIRREEPDFRLAVVSRPADQPAGLTIWRGGREMLEVLALRRRGLAAPIRVTAKDLPAGIQCPDVWIGPGQERAPLVLTAERWCSPVVDALQLIGHSDAAGVELTRPARGGTKLWPGRPTASSRLPGSTSRLTQEIALATGPESSMLVTASPGEAIVYQESVLDVTVDIERRLEGPQTDVTITGIGLPKELGNPVGIIPAGKTKGWISVLFPSSLPPGPYTIAVQAKTEVALPPETEGSKPGKATVTMVSNPIVVQLRPARIVFAVDPTSPHKVARGKTIRIFFAAERQNGFFGRINCDLTDPTGMSGLLVATGGVLIDEFDSAMIELTATKDAPLGRRPFLRLEGVGWVEDQKVYRGSRPLDIEVVE